MEKLTVSSTFQKSIGQLKNTECSSKEKAFHFAQISKLIKTPALRANSSYYAHLSTGINVLLMFCEDQDSGIRNDAQEQLFKIIRFCETNGTIVRVQIDLYHEIKKNGNERSLRICLNLFAHYCHLIKQRKARSYAQNLLPCIAAIAKRKENMLLETLSEFLKIFCKYLQICMKDNEVVEALNCFLNDIPADCAVKRRCAAQNIVTFIENSRKKEFFVMHVLLKSFDYLQKDQKPNTVIGILGLVRLLIPIIFSLENINIAKIVEVYEVCLYYLNNNTNHSILNAALEVINVILTNPPTKLKVVLTSDALEHKEILFRRKSLKNQIFRSAISQSGSRKSSYGGMSTIRVEESDTKRSPLSNSGDGVGSSQHLHPMSASQQFLRVEDISLTASDIENESFKSLEFESTTDGPLEDATHKDEKEEETMSLRSQKSTDSIGSFFNSFLTHSNTESVTKFFRNQKSTESPLNSPKNTIAEEKLIEQHTTTNDDNLSFGSMGSSQASVATQSCTDTTAITTPEIKKFEKHDYSKKQIEINDETLSLNDMSFTQSEAESSVTMNNDNNTSSTIGKKDDKIEWRNEESEKMMVSSEPKCLSIGSIFEQNLIEYTVRLVCSKFLLAGYRHVLISDQLIRVSIKSSALQTIANCVASYPKIMLKQIEKEQTGNMFDLEHLSLDVDLFSPTDDESESMFAPDTEVAKDEGAAQFLEIKEDHFGECTTSNFIDYFTPIQCSMTKSLDQGLVSLKAKLKVYEEKSINTENLNKHLDNILSKSDYTDNKTDKRNYCANTTTTETMETTTITTNPATKTASVLTTTNATMNREQKILMNIDLDEQQFITDVLLFYNHNDPILRGNVQIIIGNFIKAVYDNNRSYKKFIDFHTMDEKSNSFVELSRLIDVVSKAFNDEIHTVVKQALNAFAQIFPLLITNEPRESIVNEDAFNINDKILNYHTRNNTFLDIEHFSDGIDVKKLLNHFFHVFKNKYWLVQCKYADIISSMNFNELNLLFGEQFGKVSKDKCLSQLLIMLADNDFRVRNHVSTLIGNFIDNSNSNNNTINNRYCGTINFDSDVDADNDDDDENNRKDSLKVFFHKRIINELPSPLCDLIVSHPNRKMINSNLSKILYKLANQLLEIDNKHQQFGVVTAVKELLQKFNAINFTTIWYEFNLLSIILSYANENLTIAHDLTCQAEMMEIIPNLLAGFSTSNTLSTNIIHDVERFLQHILKILNIFYHLFSHTKPILLPKGQKRDIFIGAKELNLINNVGYFGNEHFYLRFYRILKSSYESYKISINNESGLKMFALLKKTLNSLAVLLEIKQIGSLNNSTKLIEEILLYLSYLINFVPKKCVVCIKQLLKYVFRSNYAWKKEEYDYFLNGECAVRKQYDNIDDIFAGIQHLKQIDAEQNDASDMVYMANYMKLFESTVIQCLKLFTKSNANLQASILNMLCQLLELKGINYSLLDIKNIFVNFVIKYLELIETNTIRNCDVLVPQIIKFLFHLSKQKEQKLITIPKIINLTDNILANSSIRKCAVLTLCELAYEIFFNQKLNVSENAELYEREMDTQKEVIISMMMKFLDDDEIQQMLSTIMLFNKSSSTANENEIYSAFLQNLKENKISIKNNSSFSTLNMIFNAFEKSILLESKNFIQVLTLYYDKTFKEISGAHDLSIILILIEKIIGNTEEVYLLNHIKLLFEQKSYAGRSEQPHHHQQQQQQQQQQQGSHPLNEVDYFAKSIKQTIENCLKFINLCPNDYLFGKLFRKYLSCLINLRKFSSVINCLRNILLLENNLFINLVQFSQNHNIKLFHCLFLFKMNMAFDKGILLENYVGFNLNLNDQLRKQHMYRNLFHKYEKTVDWNAEEIYYLLENDFAILFNDHDIFLTNLIANEIYSNIIVTKINELYGNDNINIPTIVFNILENVHMISANDAMNFLLTILNNKNKTVIRRNLKTIYKICEKIPDDMDMAELLSIDNLKLIDSIGRHNNSECIQNFVVMIKRIFHYESESTGSDEKINFESLRNTKVDELWILKQVQLHTSHSTPNGIINENTAHLVYEIKSESKLLNILSSKDFNISLLKDLIKITFEHMIHNFKSDCVQYNPHLNYLKIPTLLKITIIILIEHMKQIIQCLQVGHVDKDNELFDDVNKKKVEHIRNAVDYYMQSLHNLEHICLMYVEAVHVEKYMKENFWKSNYELTFLKFNTLCIQYAQYLIMKQPTEVAKIYEFFKCANGILKDKYLWKEFNSNDKYLVEKEIYIDTIFSYLTIILKGSSFLQNYSNPNVLKDDSTAGLDANKLKNVLSVVFMSKYLENVDEIEANEKNSTFFAIEPILFSIANCVLKTDQYYSYSVTPYEILINYDCNMNLSKSKLPSIPFDLLNDIEILNKFIKRINIFGFSSKQQFEEFFMSLLVLINKQNDPEMIDPQEEFEIKNMCLHAINQLLMSCYIYPNIGSFNGKYHHFTRLEKIKIDNIGLKKLHKIKLLLPAPNLFHLSNVERQNVSSCCTSSMVITHTTGQYQNNNVIGTNEFLYNQFGMKYFWQQIEDKIDVKEVTLINSKFFIEKIGIDIKSSVQLIYDIFTQMIEENYVLVLPHLVKISEMCDNADQFKWIKSTMIALRENVPMENTISHQYIIYLLCKSTAILVPSLSDLTHLCTIIPAYLKSTQLFIRNAALHGLLCLLESLTNTNTKMGRLSDELILIRNIILNYIVKHGIVEESSTIYSDMHTKLVWTLNFYLVETTTKFVADCNLLSNTIISANNILKRTSNLDLYLCILHGLERLVATNTANKLYRGKIEKLAMDLLKSDNELLSIPALKLLITCMYIGGTEQLENTEKSNGIVQDEPEIIIESTEKIDILFSRIRISTPQAAKIFGTTLCQIIQDLLPPNEILTKIIKELLVPNQQHQEVIAKITYKIFRTTIDSSYLPLLQDWLICSLPNFISLPQVNKSIWCLLLIFMSSSLNQHFIKLIPELFACPPNLTAEHINYFILASKDFYSRLNEQQRERFKEVFMKTDSCFFKDMLSCL